MTRISTILMSFLLCGCAINAPYQKPEINTGTAWKESSTTSQSAPEATWWNDFRSSDLQNLLTRAKQNNTELAASLQRIEQARAQAKIAGANLYPSVGANAGFNISDGKNQSFGNSYNANLSVAYEIDLWQRNRNTKQAAEHSLNAARFDTQALDLVITSDTAQRYFEILTYDERIRLTTETIKIFRDTMNIIDTRFKEGGASGLEVSQQRTALANAEASLSQMQQQRSITQNALAVLLGIAPAEMQNTFTSTLAALSTPDIKPVQPAALLQRRPDIQAQEERLQAAHANIAIARADIYPSLNLGLTGGLAANPSSAAPALAASLLTSMTQRIFEGGRLRGQIELAEAQKAELVQNYRTVVLTAFQETENALATIKTATEREKMLKIAMEQARTSYSIARERYLSGADDFITLLDAQRSLLQAQDTYAQAQLDRLNAALGLYKAMGGASETGKPA